MNCYDIKDQHLVRDVLADELDLYLLINNHNELAELHSETDGEITDGCLEDVFKRAEGILDENLGHGWQDL